MRPGSHRHKTQQKQPRVNTHDSRKTLSWSFVACFLGAPRGPRLRSVVDALGIEPGALRAQSGCGATALRALDATSKNAAFPEQAARYEAKHATRQHLS